MNRRMGDGESYLASYSPSNCERAICGPLGESLQWMCCHLRIAGLSALYITVMRSFSPGQFDKAPCYI